MWWKILVFSLSVHSYAGWALCGEEQAEWECENCTSSKGCVGRLKASRAYNTRITMRSRLPTFLHTAAASFSTRITELILLRLLADDIVYRFCCEGNNVLLLPTFSACSHVFHSFNSTSSSCIHPTMHSAQLPLQRTIRCLHKQFNLLSVVIVGCGSELNFCNYVYT